jgi:hypothetical protein
MTKPARRKRVDLTIDKKYENIMMIRKRERYKDIAKKFDIAYSTVRHIKSMEKDIKKYFQANLPNSCSFAKHSKLRYSIDLNRVVYQWYTRCKYEKIPLSGRMIRDKALEVNEKLEGDPNFKASYKWFASFRTRNRICLADIKKDIRIQNAQMTQIFKTKFRYFLEDEDYTLENIYNTDYAALLWKALPEDTSISRREKLTESQNMCQKHVTILLCTNVTGCHKLPALIIGKIWKIPSI